jgi:hypothetical protein
MNLARRPTRALAILGAALWVLVASNCSSEAPKAQPVGRVLVVGVDGLEWKVLGRLFAAGKCPNLAGLMQRGSFGRLLTLQPTLSPILWTTIATSKMPQEHEITGFTDADLRQFTSAQRRGRAVWNVADRFGLSSNVFGWWITWPVEPIRGVMVSGSSSSALVDANWKPTLLPGAPDQVHPPALESEVMSIAERAGALAEVQRLAREKVFGVIPDDVLGPVEQNLIRHTLWSVQSDATYHAIAKSLIRSHPADLNLVYLGGPDVSGHRFWRYYDPKPFRWPGNPEVDEQWKRASPESPPLAELLAKPEGDRMLSEVIPNYYQWVDELVGELIEAAGKDATVIVLSDHGMHASSTDKPNPKWLTGHHQDGIPGVIIAAGPGIARTKAWDAYAERGELATHASVLNVMPTLLALLGVQPARGAKNTAQLSLLEGRALANAALAPVDDYDEGFRAPAQIEVPAQMNEDFIKKFKDLGYLGLDDASTETSEVVDPKDAAPDTRSPVREDPPPR